MAIVKNVHNNRVVFKNKELESACPIIHITRSLSGNYNYISKSEADLMRKSYLEGKPCIIYTTTEDHPEVNEYSTLVYMYLDDRSFEIKLWDSNSEKFNNIYLEVQ